MVGYVVIKSLPPSEVASGAAKFVLKGSKSGVGLFETNAGADELLTPFLMCPAWDFCP